MRTRGSLPNVLLAAALLLSAAAIAPSAALAEDTCGDQTHSCSCAAHTPCICCSNGGNCVWWAWHEACCQWGIALEWCTDAATWDDYATSNGYTLDTVAQNSSIFVCEASSVCSGWGHVGYVVTAHADGSFDSTEMACGGWYGVESRTRAAGFAEHYILDPGGTPTEVDGAEFESETIPDDTHVAPGEGFTKRWTMSNTGNTTWSAAGGYVWAFDGEEQFSAAAETALAAGVTVAPGATHDWDVPMTAPLTPGTYRGYWITRHNGVGTFGTRVFVQIIVDDVPPVDTTEPVPDTTPDTPPDTAPDVPVETVPDEASPDTPDTAEPAPDSSADTPPDAADTAPDASADLPPSDTTHEGPNVLGTESACACTVVL